MGFYRPKLISNYIAEVSPPSNNRSPLLDAAWQKSCLQNPLLIFREAKRLMRTSSLVDGGRLVGREQERQLLAAFWKETVEQRQGGSLYVSGAPGVGKTALVDEFILQHKAVSSARFSFIIQLTESKSAQKRFD